MGNIPRENFYRLSICHLSLHLHWQYMRGNVAATQLFPGAPQKHIRRLRCIQVWASWRHVSYIGKWSNNKLSILTGATYSRRAAAVNWPLDIGQACSGEKSGHDLPTRPVGAAARVRGNMNIFTAIYFSAKGSAAASVRHTRLCQFSDLLALVQDKLSK